VSRSNWAWRASLYSKERRDWPNVSQRGNFGRIELLLLAGSLLGDHRSTSQAHTLAINVLKRGSDHGHYVLGGDSKLPNPTFHQGLASTTR
jgi:hypothetical protein